MWFNMKKQYSRSLIKKYMYDVGCDGLIDVLSHRLYRYHRGGGGSFEFFLFSSLSLGFK